MMTTEQLRQIHVLLYSFAQGCFHLETLDDTVSSGRTAYATPNPQQDYIVIAVGSTREEVSLIADELREKYGLYPRTRAHFVESN